jgi:hypothetical protein
VRISEKWFSKQILCGLCNYGCCNSQSFHVEFSKDEINYLGTKYNKDIKPIEYQNGKCSHLNGNGCSFGDDDKPTYCKTFPITENKNNTLVLSNWSWLHCPKPSDYILDRKEDGKWYYRLKKKHKNKRDELVLDNDINDYPNFFEREDLQGVLNDER